ncbi:MAG: hypothetical protein M3354_02175 [Chloroflexota bacterium]|nr:hypothetical protein [Chloroflexota bacterium]
MRRWPDLTEEERREIELAENLDRKDLTAFERSRVIADLAGTAAEVDRAELRADSARNSGRGRPEEGGSIRRVAARTGIPAKTIHDSQRHVETAEAHPVFQRRDWTQKDVLSAKKAIEKLPPEQRTEIVDAVTATTVDARHAVPILATIANLPEEERSNALAAETPAEKSARLLALAGEASVAEKRAKFLSALTNNMVRADSLMEFSPEDVIAAIDDDDRRRLRQLQARLNAWFDRVTVEPDRRLRVIS